MARPTNTTTCYNFNAITPIIIVIEEANKPSSPSIKFIKFIKPVPIKTIPKDNKAFRKNEFPEFKLYKLEVE